MVSQLYFILFYPQFPIKVERNDDDFHENYPGFSFLHFMSRNTNKSIEIDKISTRCMDFIILLTFMSRKSTMLSFKIVENQYILSI